MSNIALVVWLPINLHALDVNILTTYIWSDKALQDVHLAHKADAMINQISDGEKQRAVIAKALTQDTPLVLLDEPTAHLDLPNRIEIMLLLRRLSVSTGKSFILSTHELDLALQMADKIWLMTPQGVEPSGSCGVGGVKR